LSMETIHNFEFFKANLRVQNSAAVQLLMLLNASFNMKLASFIN
jgi:hypothetical protein